MPLDLNTLLSDYQAIRNRFTALCEPLELDDYSLQAEIFTSPPKWHLAHTTWFFETFLLKSWKQDYRSVQPLYEQLFNSYYNTVGQQYPRNQRGLLSRPPLHEVIQYRNQVDQSMTELLRDSLLDNHCAANHELFSRTQLGIEHEKQHQELFFTDLKYCLFQNPLFPAYQAPANQNHDAKEQPLLPIENEFGWVEFEGGLSEIGVPDDASTFHFDNEGPCHTVYLQPFALRRSLVTNAEYQAFIDDGGYQNHRWWLADGWSIVQKHAWDKPLYWVNQNNKQQEFSLHGLIPRNPHSPVCHLSGYEADAFASWAGARLPTEAEWEHAAKRQENLPPLTTNNYALERIHPFVTPGEASHPLLQLYDTCWQWTQSAYRPYPGFKTSAGAIGEYNGKFMCNQWVLKGGSCVSPPNHVRATYRNFFYPEDRWQFSGIRLAKDL